MNPTISTKVQRVIKTLPQTNMEDRTAPSRFASSGGMWTRPKARQKWCGFRGKWTRALGHAGNHSEDR